VKGRKEEVYLLIRVMRRGILGDSRIENGVVICRDDVVAPRERVRLDIDRVEEELGAGAVRGEAGGCGVSLHGDSDCRVGDRDRGNAAERQESEIRVKGIVFLLVKGAAVERNGEDCGPR
jgi:hypothetical protein